MPVAALMTLFSSGVQGVGVRGWTLPDGSGGGGRPCQQESVGNRITAQKRPTPKTHWCTLMATTVKKIAGRYFRVGSCNLTMMRVKRRMWPYFDCGLFEF